MLLYDASDPNTSDLDTSDLNASDLDRQAIYQFHTSSVGSYISIVVTCQKHCSLVLHKVKALLKLLT